MEGCDSMSKIKSASIDRLFQVILQLESLDECYRFFEDICTVKELQDLAQRLDVAVMLGEGKKYQEIAKAVGASTSTISRVNKCFLYGDGGYRRALQKLFPPEEQA